MAPTRTGPLIDEESALIPGSGRSRQQKKMPRGVMCNRYLILMLLVAMVLLSVRYQQQINILTEQIQENQQSIQKIHTTLAFHEEVIDRFNASVTNADVIAQLSLLQNSLNQTSVYLQDQLVRVQTEVEKQLTNTVKELSDTVAQAEQEISDEVEKVKKDVEHYVITTQDQFSMENSFMVYQLAGTFTLLSCLISMWHMTAHLRKMEQPMVQRKILAILWMSPIYAVTSWFSLVFHQAEGYLAIIKDGYEAYIIYQFLSFCIAVIGRGDRDAVVDVLARHAEHLTPPFRLLGCFEMCGWCMPDPYPDNRALAHDILLQCQQFAMQFVLFRPLTTTAMVVLKNMDYYGAGEGPTDYRAPQFYITIVQNLSIFVAFTGLLKFYHAVDKELAWCRPLAKFLCIKGVVFMTFWQGLAISVLAQTTDVAGNDKEEWAMSAQNFLICLEMLLFSIAHFYCFPTDEWQEGYRIKHQGGQFGDTIALGDFFQDVKLILAGTERKSSKRRRKKSAAFSTKSLEEINAPSVTIMSKSMSSKAASRSTLSAASSAGKMEREEAFVDLEQPNLSEPHSNDSEEEDDDDSEDGSYETDDSEDTDPSSEEDLNDDQKLVKRALKRSLGIAGNDPDIMEATKRLLENNLLSPDFFHGSDDELPASLYGAFGDSHDDPRKKHSDESDDDDDDSESDDDDDDSEFDESSHTHGDETHDQHLPQGANEEGVDSDFYIDDGLDAEVEVSCVEKPNDDHAVESAEEHILKVEHFDKQVSAEKLMEEFDPTEEHMEKLETTRTEESEGKQPPSELPVGNLACSFDPVGNLSPTSMPAGKQARSVDPVRTLSPTSIPASKLARSAEPVRNPSPTSIPTGRLARSAEPVRNPSPTSIPTGRLARSAEPVRNPSPTSIPTGRLVRSTESEVPVGKQIPTSIPSTKQAPSEKPVEKQTHTSSPSTKQAPTENPVGKQSATSIPLMKQATTENPVGKQSATSIHSTKQATAENPVGKQSATSIPSTKQATTSTGIPVGKQARTSDPARGTAFGLPSDAWPEREIISSALSSVSACMSPIEEDALVVHESKSDGALNSKESITHKKKTTPDRAYKHEGLEFLTPERMGSEDLRPSIFTTISLLDRKGEEEEESEDEP